MLGGVFWSPPEPFSSPARPILRPGRFLVMWALCCFPPAAEIPHEVDGGDDGAYVFRGDRAAHAAERRRVARAQQPGRSSCLRRSMLPDRPLST